jgi:hypothetical protein
MIGALSGTWESRMSFARLCRIPCPHLRPVHICDRGLRFDLGPDSRQHGGLTASWLMLQSLPWELMQSGLCAKRLKNAGGIEQVGSRTRLPHPATESSIVV